jgi:CheY-like chemotaxis protein
VRQTEIKEGDISLIFLIKDSGIGMTGEQIECLFKPFVQADNSITRRFGGTGLGLAICRHLAELMRGNIVVTSVAGEGSVFRLQLTLAVASQEQIGVQNPQTESHKQLQHQDALLLLSGKRVLLVEDNRVNQMLASHMLKRLGMQFDIANNGEESIQKLQEASYDIVLMDIQMPVMGGLEATQRIRQDARFASLAIVAMSAGVTLDEQEKCASVGMSGFIGKPIDSAELTAKLVEFCSKTGSK